LKKDRLACESVRESLEREFNEAFCDFLRMIPINDTPSGATFAIKVHPRARKNAITGELGDALKVALTAPPLDGRANEACIEFFAKILHVPRASVSIAAGQSGRNKVIRVAGLSAEEVQAYFNRK